jgi:rRNA maturation endonuclease Nob1
LARPSKKQEAERKAAKVAERRALKLERGYLLTPFFALSDWAYVICEKCGQEQSDRDVCFMCGHATATTHPLHDEFRAELDRLAQAV